MANRTIKTAQLHTKMIKNKKKVVFLLLHSISAPNFPFYTYFLCSYAAANYSYVK